MVKIISILLTAIVANAKPIKVAVLDTGITNSDLPICQFIDATDDKDGVDYNGHGQNITHIIDKEAAGIEYCQIIIKIFGKNGKSASIGKAIRTAIYLNADIINLSFGGSGIDRDEYLSINQALDLGIIVVAAAGNDGKDLTNNCFYYPACYDNRIIIVGNTAKSSNYGKPVKLVVNGNNVSAGGYRMSGTSQATAIVTGKLIKVLNKRRAPASYKEANDKLLEAAGKYYKIDDYVQKELKQFKIRYKKISKYANVIIPTLNSLVKQKVELQYEF